MPIAVVYPNTYQVGMSNLGLHVIYRLFNNQPDIVCERVFYEEQDHPPISLESQRRLDEFAVLAFTISFEMDCLNLLTMLRRAGIPLSSEERSEDYPLLIAGGPCVTANPEPLATIFDAFAIGEGEVVVSTLTETLLEGMNGNREELLTRLGSIPGIYVPRFYQIERDKDRIAGISSPMGLPYPVQRQWLSNLDTDPTSSVIMTEGTEFGDMYLMEVTRGCHRGCHFCLAGFAYLPARERSLETLLAQAREGLKYRRKLGLIGASLSDYSHVEELAMQLRGMGAAISVASLRVDPLPQALLRALAESGVQTLTIAPEAGSERLRRKIRKGISTSDIIHAVELAARYDFPQLKLYFMAGLPTETDDDVKELVSLVQDVRKRFSRRLTVNVTPFVPKAQTPYQRVAMAPQDVLERRVNYVKRALRPINVEIKAESSRWAQVQGILARGDRLIGDALMSLEGSSLSAWRRALDKVDLRPEPYLGNRSKDEVLPWATVSAGIGVEQPRQDLAKEAV